MADPGERGAITATADDRETAMRKLVRKAGELEDNRMALSTIMDAIKICRCNADGDDSSGTGKTRHQKDKSCNIHQCITAVRTKDPDALYNVANAPCTCGYEWPSCDYHIHAQILDALADRLHITEQYVSAFSTALSIIRLDPASCVGYCRAAKILRYLLKDSNKSDHRVKTSLTSILQQAKLASADMLNDVMKRLVKNGVHNRRKHSSALSDSYYHLLCRMAYNLKLDACKRDPVRRLPAEMLSMVFKNIGVSSLCRGLRVSKQWNRAIQGDKTVWAEIRLIKPRNAARQFTTFLQRHYQEITSFAIENVKDFSMTDGKLHGILYGLPRLKRLDLNTKHWPVREAPPGFGLPGRTIAGLTHLTLDTFPDYGVVMQILDLTAGTLEMLDLKNIDPGVDVVLGSGTLSKLKTLRLTGALDRAGRGLLQMQQVVIATPNLEAFYLNGFSVIWTRQVRTLEEIVAINTGLWPHLRKIVLGPSLTAPPMDAVPPIRGRCFPLLADSLRSIEILCPDPLPAHNLLFAGVPSLDPLGMGGDNPPSLEYPNLPNLEAFRCRTTIAPNLLQPLLEPAAQSGTLEVLELAAQSYMGSPPDPWLRQLLQSRDIMEPAKEFAFAHSANIHTLGLHDFNWKDNKDVLTPGFNGQPFLDWLDCFPKLHTVHVYPGRHEKVETFIMRVIDHPRVKVVHQDVLSGAARDVVLQFARTHKVKVHHTSPTEGINRDIIED